MNEKKSFLEGRIRSIGYALKGALLLIRTEASIKVQVFFALLAIAAGFYFEISTVEWMIQVMAISLVLAVEGMNTALEKLSDYVQPEFHNKIGFIKDIAAGAVFYTAIGAFIVGCLIYVPKVF